MTINTIDSSFGGLFFNWLKNTGIGDTEVSEGYRNHGPEAKGDIGGGGARGRGAPYENIKSNV